MRFRIILVTVLLIAARSFAQSTQPAQVMTEDQKIERLIQIVDQMPDATFIRNGKEYDCHAAAKHMRDKWQYAKKHITSAQEFIDAAASRSSISGKPYLIRFKDRREIESGTFLKEELKKLQS